MHRPCEHYCPRCKENRIATSMLRNRNQRLALQRAAALLRPERAQIPIRRTISCGVTFLILKLSEASARSWMRSPIARALSASSTRCRARIGPLSPTSRRIRRAISPARSGFATGPNHVAAVTTTKDGRCRTNPTAGKIRNTAHSMRMANNGRSRSLRRDRGLEVTSSTGQGH